MWLRVLEVWLTARLLGSPTFHRGVRRVHKKVHELRHGKDPAEVGDVSNHEPNRPNYKKFLKYYMEELKDQFRGSTKK